MIYARLVYHDTEADRGGQHTNKVLSCVLCRRVISGQDGGGDALCAGCVRVLVGREPRWAHEICRDAVREAEAGHRVALEQLASVACEATLYPEYRKPEPEHCPHCRARAALDGLAKRARGGPS